MIGVPEVRQSCYVTYEEGGDGARSSFMWGIKRRARPGGVALSMEGFRIIGEDYLLMRTLTALLP